MASSTPTTIQGATSARGEDLDAKSISSLTTVQASNKVTPGSTMANVSHNEEEKSVGSFTASAEPSGPADPQLFDPPPVQHAFADPNGDEPSGLTESEEELDPDLQAEVQAIILEAREKAREKQRLRRIKKNKAMHDEEEKIKKRPRRDDGDDDDGGGDSKPPPAAGGAGVGAALAVK